MKNRVSQRRSGRRRGLSMMEVVVSTLLVGVVLVGALRCAGGVITGRVRSGDTARAALLAHDLIAEITVEPYLDEGASPTFGLEPGEIGWIRLLFDDVDDYHGWSSSPPKRRSGMSYADLVGWQRDVTVEWVQPADPAVVIGTDQGLKRITVTVSRNGETLARAVAIRSDRYIVE